MGGQSTRVDKLARARIDRKAARQTGRPAMHAWPPAAGLPVTVQAHPPGEGAPAVAVPGEPVELDSDLPAADPDKPARRRRHP